MRPGGVRPVSWKPRLYREHGEWACVGLRKTGWWIFKTEEMCWAVGKTPKEAYDRLRYVAPWVH
jgi:hypothetical protein